MTEVRYKEYEGAYSLNIAGHSCYAEKGKDIVCAAVSILTQACIHSIAKLCRTGRIRAPTIEYGSNSAYINFYGEKETVEPFMLSTLTGFKLLAENYPDNVKYIEGFLYNQNAERQKGVSK